MEIVGSSENVIEFSKSNVILPEVDPDDIIGDIMASYELSDDLVEDLDGLEAQSTSSIASELLDLAQYHLAGPSTSISDVLALSDRLMSEINQRMVAIRYYVEEIELSSSL
jgi:hypothetical protein